MKQHIGFIAGLIVSFILGILILYHHDNPYYLLFGVMLAMGYYLHSITLAHIYVLHQEDSEAKTTLQRTMVAAAGRFIFYGIVCVLAWLI
jgi:hypothetical protein